MTWPGALTIVDLLLNGQLATVETNEPPADPQQGEAHLVGSAPVGAWSGHEGAIAGYTPGGWRFIEPYEGLKMTVAGTGLTAVYGQTGWTIGDVVVSRVMVDGQQVIGGRSAAIANPADGSLVDMEARATIAAILAAMRSHGLIDN